MIGTMMLMLGLLLVKLYHSPAQAFRQEACKARPKEKESLKIVIVIMVNLVNMITKITMVIMATKGILIMITDLTPRVSALP